MDQLSDEAIINRVLQGETDLYENLMRKYNERLYRISLSIVQNDKEAEDVMQIAYINAYRQLGSFRHQCSFGTWLTRILINESLLHKKRGQRTEQLHMETPFTEEHHETPLSGLINKELKLVLEKAVAALPEKYRIVFVMREVQGMSTNETMEALDLTESNIKVRLNRAKEMLRTDLQRLWNPRELYEFNLVRCDVIVNNVMMVINAS
ncbi:MAG: sigma-70 family RNA polymerase sigma factor [Mucilaginibacter sp.]|uniref:sigma-70 family RNA polymerase sigma factor n=1 Tax=Mucilaginibacter sp. TaxID=1882438 RepID=UPI0031B1465C